ncbi:MAG: type I secretion system permease/ATPase [Alphaproteobacteria bacterium]|nr:type I secretion system permease/ATPase [Alphaproteobacteria bacterium]PPR13742.1 MAG: Type I secretion system ATP-binding protein PrsD [Alphaproteobacteria bacterium MarineAlpha12_Bin1]|tara:strand:- start:2553 stop:4280 length:1728 start_codon:yes stop_codon:yes gene_type:complete
MNDFQVLQGKSIFLTKAIRACRPNVLSVIFFSAFINLLMLVAPLYMLQVYDRVLMSKSYETLTALTIIAMGCLVVYGLLEFVRSRILIRTGLKLDEYLNERVFRVIFKASIGNSSSASAQALRDTDTIREFLSGGAIIAFCDAPWVPLFIVAGFLLHPWLGMVSLGGAIVIFILALINEISTRRLMQEASEESLSATHYAQTSLRNAEVVHALGMISSVMNIWGHRHSEGLKRQSRASDRGGTILSISRFVRLALQVGILGVGAYLAVRGDITPGTMIAGSIIMGRALAPVEMGVGQWRTFVFARNAYRRLNYLLSQTPLPERPMSLPEPVGEVTVNRVIVVPPGAESPVLMNVSLSISPGEALAVIGPSGSGKSSLARAMVGVWAPHSGSIRYDGAELSQWDPEQLGPYLGYMPQDVELFSGTVADNISRFQQGDSTSVVEAALKAGVHELILEFPDGYNTQLGENGLALSGGQRQRIALARALYGNPKVLILDEPNANLDTDGEQALAEALQNAKDSGQAIVVISHRAALLSIVDKVAVLKEGVLARYGERDAVLADLNKAKKPLAISTEPGE